MLKPENEIRSRDEIDAVIRVCQVCRVAFADGNQPYLLPFSFGYDGEKIYLHTARDGRKIDIIERNQRVGFEFEQGVELKRAKGPGCNWDFRYRCVIGQGRIRELISPQEKNRALGILVAQYGGEVQQFPVHSVDATRVWAIEIEAISGKRSE